MFWIGVYEGKLFHLSGLQNNQKVMIAVTDSNFQITPTVYMKAYSSFTNMYLLINSHFYCTLFFACDQIWAKRVEVLSQSFKQIFFAETIM